MSINKFQGLARSKSVKTVSVPKTTPSSNLKHPNKFKRPNAGMTRRADMKASFKAS